MGSATELIKNVSTPEYKKIVIETPSKRYYSDLSDFEKVYCFPSINEWGQVSIDSHGIDLIWPGRFEVHINQVIDRAYKVESLLEAS